ncbi:hypothetical protein FOA52_001898 [Chlamydomonas sp. UWO 241]|nr:hypothetical protein FOA52_001898 [Chlamydomonas sp. UWO 241]
MPPTAPAPAGVTHDEDGVPIKYLVLCLNPTPNRSVGPAIVKEVLGIVEMLASKGKFQKAANLLYACVLGDSNNEPLRARWVDMIAKTNTQNIEIAGARVAAEAEAMRKLDQAGKQSAVLSETKRWDALKQQGKLPANNPNWALEKLKPWMGPQAIEIGMKHKAAAERETDGFKKVFAYEEATKMFNKVLEIKSSDDQARRLLGECCAAMNAEYQKMRNVKRQAKTLDPDCPLTKVGDFMQTGNAWVKNVRAQT